MQQTITATFDSVDEADRAVSRLRQFVGSTVRETEEHPLGSLPADAPYMASVYYPYRPLNLPTNFLNGVPYEIGGRVLYTSDILGMKLYRDDPTELQLTLPGEQIGLARSLLRNAGGRDIRLE